MVRGTAITRGIHRGASTQTHDQVIQPVSFRTIKIRVRIAKNEGQADFVAFVVVVLVLALIVFIISIPFLYLMYLLYIILSFLSMNIL